jgi:hypothetical protein
MEAYSIRQHEEGLAVVTRNTLNMGGYKYEKN